MRGRFFPPNENKNIFQAAKNILFPEEFPFRVLEWPFKGSEWPFKGLECAFKALERNFPKQEKLYPY